MAPPRHRVSLPKSKLLSLVLRHGLSRDERTTGKVYVVGAGLAGLSAATILAARGARVTLYRGAGQAGGRCRSYFDPTLGQVIDNGNHLVLSGNHAVHDYLARIGARGRACRADAAPHSPFVDLRERRALDARAQ